MIIPMSIFDDPWLKLLRNFHPPANDQSLIQHIGLTLLANGYPLNSIHCVLSSHYPSTQVDDLLLVIQRLWNMNQCRDAFPMTMLLEYVTHAVHEQWMQETYHMLQLVSSEFQHFMIQPDHVVFNIVKGCKRAEHIKWNQEWYVWNGHHWLYGLDPMFALLRGEVRGQIETRRLHMKKLLDTCSLLFPFEAVQPYKSVFHQAQLFLSETWGSIQPLKHMLQTMQPAFYDCQFHVDQKPHLVGFQNGVFDLQQYAFRPMQPEDCITNICSFSFKPLMAGMEVNHHKIPHGHLGTTTDQEEWKLLDDYLVSLFPDPIERLFFMKLQSQMLTGTATNRLVFFCGTGSNGKQTLLSLLESMMHRYAMTSVGELENPWSLDDLHAQQRWLHKRLCIMRNNRSIQYAFVKQLIRPSNPDFTFTTHCIVPTNHYIPFQELVYDYEHIVCIPFRTTFTDQPELVNPDQHIALQNPLYASERFRQQVANVFMNRLLEQHHIHQCNMDMPLVICRFTHSYIVKTNIVLRNFFKIYTWSPNAIQWTKKDIVNHKHTFRAIIHTIHLACMMEDANAKDYLNHDRIQEILCHNKLIVHGLNPFFMYNNHWQYKTENSEFIAQLKTFSESCNFF